jgi:hypothetical protein
MASPKRRGQAEAPVKASFPFDAATMVCVEGCDGHRVIADRNCVATARRLADMIPPLVPPPPPPAPPPRAGAKERDAPPAPPPTNRGPSDATPYFEGDVAPAAPQSAAQLTAPAGPGAAARLAASTSVATPMLPVVRVACLDGRQLEAAMRIAYLKYAGDNTPDPERRRSTAALGDLGVSTAELLAISTILGA